MSICNKCGERERKPGQRWCRECHAAYMRAWRQTHPLSEEDRRKDACRSYSMMLVKRGKLAPEPCQTCGAEPAQRHHPDYSNPYRVVWLCDPCHRAHHKPRPEPWWLPEDNRL